MGLVNSASVPHIKIVVLLVKLAHRSFSFDRLQHRTERGENDETYIFKKLLEGSSTLGIITERGWLRSKINGISSGRTHQAHELPSFVEAYVSLAFLGKYVQLTAEVVRLCSQLFCNQK